MKTIWDWNVVFIDDEADIREVGSIILTEDRMPGIGGIEVLETLKYTLPNIEMVVATAFDKMVLAIRALQLDASDFIAKPVNSEALPRAMTRAKFHYIAHKLNPGFPLHDPAGS